MLKKQLKMQRDVKSNRPAYLVLCLGTPQNIPLVEIQILCQDHSRAILPDTRFTRPPLRMVKHPNIDKNAHGISFWVRK